MGTWGFHSFENDDAVEWAAAYREMGLSVAASTIRIALEDHANNRLSADIAARAVAAVEAVALALGRGSDDAARHFDGAPEAGRAEAEALVSDANDVIMAITGGSELAQLWKQAERGEQGGWLQSLTDLRTRLNGGIARPEVATETAEPGAVSVSDAAVLEDIRKAIGGLSYDIEVLRQEMAENFARLSSRIEGTGR